MRQPDLGEKLLENTGKLNRLLKSKLSQFYKTFMPFFSTKNKTDNDHLSLTIDGDVGHDRPKIANHLCNYFVNNAHGVGNIDEISAHMKLYRISSTQMVQTTSTSGSKEG